jgi:hypothetical protein
MSILDIPINRNFLSPTGGTLQIKKLPTTVFFAQKMNIPGVGVSNVPQQPTPFIQLPQTSDHMLFQEFKIQFSVDEDLKNYQEIFNWIVGINFPDNFSQYKELNDQPKFSGLGLKSDMSLIINTNGKIPNIEVNFIDAFPVDLSSIDIDTTDNSITYVTAQASFIYEKYTFNKLR